MDVWVEGKVELSEFFFSLSGAVGVSIDAICFDE